MYVMESLRETRRLLEQERASDARRALLLTGLGLGDRALDAGCGPGGITETMADVVGPEGHVTGVELNPERVAEASLRCQRRPNLGFLQADICRMELPDATFDYSWSQFVFEYLPDRLPALREMARVTRPGGKVVVSEIDGLGFQNWPFAESLREGTQRIVDALAARGFDLFAGRKLFTEFRQVGLRDIQVHLLPFYMVAGAADDRLLMDWEIRFAALEAVAVPFFGGQDAYRAYCREYLRMLADPDGLKYAVLLVTEGTKP